MLAARTGLSPVMVGRADELARLRELAAGDGGPAVALVSGEAGIGKTRLVAELVATLDPTLPVLAGQGSQGAPGRPFQLLLEAVEAQVAGWDAVPGPLADRAEPLRLLLAPVAPKLAGHTEREFGQEELLRAAVVLVRELAGPQGALLVFEDLHWADAESVALFGRLAVTPDLPLVLVGTFRPEGIARRHPLVELLADLERQRLVTTVALERLGRAGVAELLAAVYRGPVPFQVAEALHRRTGGNPFFLEELVVTAGRADPARLATLPLPWNLSEAVLRRLDDLDPTQRRVVDAAAILGRRISFDLLAAVTGSGEDELIAVLRHLVAENVMAEEEPDVFAFRHALTREAIAGRLLGRERRRLHEKALAAIQEAGGDDWAAIAWHAQGADRYDELVEAARAGAWSYLHKGSTAEALRLAETGLSEAERDLDLLAAASKAAWMIGLLSLAVEHGERWHTEAAVTGDPATEAGALIHLARLYWEARDFQRQWQTVWAALRVAEPLGESRTLAHAYALVSEAHMLAERGAEAVEWADKALAMADAVGAPGVRAAALVNKGTALSDTEDGHDQGIALLEQAIVEAEAGDFGYVLHRALHNLFMQEVGTWSPERSRQVLRQMQQTGDRTGRGSEAPSWAMGRSAIAVVEGDLEAALAGIGDARSSQLVPIEGLVDPFWIDLHEASLLLEAGQLEPVTELLGRYQDAASDRADPCDIAWQWGIRLGLGARRGDLEAARAALAGYLSAPAWRGWGWKHGIPGLSGLLTALRAGFPAAEVRPLLDAIDRADPAAGAGPDATARRSPRRVGRQHLEAALLEAGGDPAAALDAYRQVLAHADLYRAAHLRADCHLGAARCLLALDDQPGALDHARQADRLLERWPGWRRDEVAALLRRLGGRPAPAGDPSPLTPREREVAALLAEGCSNGEIARRLYISTKTASVHVSNILAKLEMTSRAEVAAWAVRSGLGTAP
jgi:DNA-binding CsgD family transcriptional regulator/tetratricopeptide (TPR) repeat protein